MIRASVAMVTYNGERFVKEQLETILESMGEQDELIISDDGSTDKTLEILKEYEKNDGRIRLLQGPGQGVKQNVNHVLKACGGKYIFLADQDDIWKPEKIETVIDAFVSNDCGVVVHDAVVVKEDGEEILRDSFFSIRHSGQGVFKNIWRNTYIGCCMAFQKELLEYILPIPDSIEMHDQWIGVVNDMRGLGTCFLEEKLISYRRHGGNASSMKHYGVRKMLSNRMAFIRALKQRRRDLHNGVQY